MTGCSPESTDLEARLGHTFKDRGLLKRALTHASADGTLSNERLEFLGDRVLGLIVAEELHARYPADAEGALALKFNALARRDACAAAADAAGLADHLILANSEAGSGGRRKAAILAGACEAIIAALYLDGGMDAARRFVDCYWTFDNLSSDMRDPEDDSAGMGAGAKVRFLGACLSSDETCGPGPRAALRSGSVGERRGSRDGRGRLQARS